MFISFNNDINNNFVAINNSIDLYNLLIVFFFSFWHQMEFRFMGNRSEKCNYNQNSDGFNQIQQKIFGRVEKDQTPAFLLEVLIHMYIYTLLRVSEANEVPISSHIWVGLSTFNWL